MADSQPDSNIFSVRIVSIDHYMAPPIPGIDVCFSSFQGGKVNEVPVIRIYGSTPAGQKTCLHVHQALPYLYVPFADILPSGSHSQEEDGAMVDALAFALEKALKLKGSASSKRQHVHGCSIVRAKKFYGYHSSEELFVKINLYYPHDVSRAADLLLGGAVLDKSLQPHESHIPFILQFLIDYNLYGMGCVHLSKMKFRQPVPGVFLSRKFNVTGKCTQERDDFTSGFSDFQADSSHDPSLSSPVWISSKIPHAWIWNNSSEFDELSGQDICHVKRQSVCELEVDATIDDILNQQFKMFTSLSQNCSDVKMVQSLIPIWEEEYGRTGICGELSRPDPDKPVPEGVLRTLLVGLGLEDRLNELYSEVKEALHHDGIKFEHVVVPSTEERKLTMLSHVSSNDKCPDHLNSLEEQNIMDSGSELTVPCKKEMDAAPSMPKDTCALQSPEIIVPSNQKARDVEVLELLRWLATSQAAEEINSDDELVHGTILTPLLPATTIDKVLEKASLDFDSESQKECQDILDSIEDLVNFEDQKEGSSSPLVDHTQISLDRKIPQTDGSADDLFLTAAESAENSTKTEVESEYKRSSHHLIQQDGSAQISSKRKRKNNLWGSLPICIAKNVSNDSDTANFQTINAFANETKELSTSFSAENKLGELSDSLITDMPSSDYATKGATSLVECSVRDLMRKKRSHRMETAESDSLGMEKINLKGGKNEDIFLYRKQLDFYGLHDNVHEKQAAGSLNYKPLVIDESVASRPTYSGSVDGTAVLLSDNDEPRLVSKGPVQLEEKIPHTFYSKNQYSTISIHHLGTSNSTVSNFAATSAGPIGSESTSSMDYRWQQTNTSCSASCLSAFPVRHGNIHKCSRAGIDSMPIYKLVGADVSSDMQHEDCSGNKQEGDIGLCGPGYLPAEVGQVDTTSAGLVTEAFRKEHPTAAWIRVASADVSLSPTIPKPDVERGNHQGTSEGRALDQILPFLPRDCQGGEEVKQKNIGNENSSFCREASAEIPTYYQNDGSFLYLLTPFLSPPSADSVNRWVLCSNEGSLGEINKVPVEPPSLKDSSQSLNVLDTLSPDDSTKDTEPVVESPVRPISDQSHKEKDVTLAAELKPYSNNVTAILPGEGTIAKLCPSSDDSRDISQISGPDGKSRPTPLSQIGFRDPASVGAGQQLTLLSIEVQAESRGDLQPDPRFDAINVIALALQGDSGSMIDVYVLLNGKNGSSCKRNLDGTLECKLFVFSEEKELFEHFIKILRSFDPDILMGWDVQGGSLGFLAERAAHLGIGLLNHLSRTPYETKIAAGELAISENGLHGDLLSDPLTAESAVLESVVIEDEWGRTHASGVHVGGRIVLNVWRLMRHEVKLTMYSIEAVAESVLRRKVPSIPYKVLTKWFLSGPARARYRCIEYVIERAKLNLQIMDQLDMINRTSELARIFGIDFFSVLSRGSQYRVESMFLRLAHTQNYLAISPGKQQVASQPAMECLPLVMEPESGFYADPVVVLDFQSLYPSMIIAYNLCFCTCLGKIAPSKANTLGVSPFMPDPNVLRDLKDKMLLTPNGVMYVPSKVRKGVLPRLLEEILSTRIMVKQAMKKLNPSQQVLHRIFNARQLALKLIANVTYGYTAAGFSGRMPCAELADSIVQCGRSTLEKAISFVNTNDKWKAKVIYGDTDSMFVLLKGRTVKESLQIGHEIASAVTAMNPNPVTLKMEKVYHPCFLLTKKRYVGYSYESPDQVKPVFDAKGIETVRRDTCGAVAKTMEQSLRNFFEHQDILKVKAYLQRQWTRILSGRVSLQDFVFAKEVRLGTYSTRVGSSLPPAAIVATKAMKADPRAEPRYAERVPYVVIHGEPGARLVDMVVDPLELLTLDSPYRLNDMYYINKQIIPTLQRVFGLVGADLNQWFLEMPRPARVAFGKRNGELAAATAIIGRTSKLEKEMQHLAAICRHCGGGDWLVESGVKCNSLACSMFYERRKVQKELQALSAVATNTGFYPKCTIEWF
ncbi:hypothetical protein SLA2020_239300 [Shorea laevis]